MEDRAMTMPRARVFALSALVLFAAAAIAFGWLPWAAAIDYSHRTHPLSWLGANGVPGGMWFDALAFVLPGALAVAALWPLRDALPAVTGRSARIGARLVLPGRNYEPVKLYELLEGKRVTLTCGVPSFWLILTEWLQRNGTR